MFLSATGGGGAGIGISTVTGGRWRIVYGVGNMHLLVFRRRHSCHLAECGYKTCGRPETEFLMDRADGEISEILIVEQTPASLSDPEFVEIGLE